MGLAQRGQQWRPTRLSEEEIRRYARHIVLPEFGGIGQLRLKAARVLVIGAGGLGSPVLLYLAAAGVGRARRSSTTIGSISSNLQRQVIFATVGRGPPKAGGGSGALARPQPAWSRSVSHRSRLDAANARELVDGYDLVADGSDNLADPARRSTTPAATSAGRW